jgi:sporulation protein YlmC with PRC-barrel domain
MMHPTRAGIGLVRLGDSDFLPANPENEVRGKVVYDAQGQRIGGVEDLYIDPQERRVRFLEVGAGGFLGIGEKRILVPVEAVTRVAEDRVTIEPGRTEKVDGPAPFDTKVAPSRANEPREDYASRPWGNNAEETADQRRDIHSSLPYGRWPY